MEVDAAELTEDDVDSLHPLYVPTLCNYGAMLERVHGKVDEAEVSAGSLQRPPQRPAAS